MAAGNFIPYDKSFINRVLQQQLPYLLTTVKMALLDNAHTPAPTTDQVWADVSGDEIADGDYSQQTLTSQTITQDGSNRTVFDAADVDFGDAVTISARYAVVYCDAAQFSIRDSRWNWEASGSGTNEYYLQRSSADPNLPEPSDVLENDSSMTPGTAGSLAAGEWDYGDNDSLGYSTIYVRLADDADPDSKAVGYVEAEEQWLLGYIDLNDGGSANVSSTSSDFDIAFAAAGMHRVDPSP